MKITAPKIFEAQKIIQSLTAAKVTGIEDFINGLCDLSQQVVSILQKRVSVRDNMDCIEKTFTVKILGEVVRFLPPDQKKIRHMVSTRTSDFLNGVQLFTWRYIESGEIEISIYCTTSTPNDVTFIMYY